MLVRKLPVSITRGSLIDFETTGINPETSEIITLGCVTGNTLEVFQRKTRKPDPFYAKIKAILDSLPHPIHAYNLRGMEQPFASQLLNVRLGGVDLMDRWKGLCEKIPDPSAPRGRKKWPKLDELVSEPEQYFESHGVVERITGANIPVLWENYLNTRQEKHLKLIIRHCESDLLRELYLLLRYPENGLNRRGNGSHE